MTKTDQKEALCDQHRPLLYLILRFGNGAMLLPQLRTLALALGLYSNGQAVNRAVRALREAGILSRQTWIDNNADLIVVRKYAIRYFSGATSQEVATPRRPSTTAPYITQARKIDFLLDTIGKAGLSSIEAVENYLSRHASTMFLRLPDLLGYCRRHAPLLAREYPDNYRRQMEQMEASAEQRSRMARQEPPQAPALLSGAVPLLTLEQMHRRGVYVTAINPHERAVALALFPGRDARAERVADWSIDAYTWVMSLLPYYRALMVVHTLDEAHKQALTAALTATVDDCRTNYWHYRLEGNRMEGLLHLRVVDTDFINKWCGGVRRIEI